MSFTAGAVERVLQRPSKKLIEVSLACLDKQRVTSACQLVALCVYWLTMVVVRSAVLGINSPLRPCLSPTVTLY